MTHSNRFRSILPLLCATVLCVFAAPSTAGAAAKEPEAGTVPSELPIADSPQHRAETAEIETGAGRQSSGAAAEAPTAPPGAPDEPPSGSGSAISPVLPAATVTDVYLMAHPDDELQLWSLVDLYGDNANVHKVFALLTRGEQTSHCTSTALSAFNPGEVAPVPPPYQFGMWSAECEEARINSTVGFMRDTGSLYTAMDRAFSERSRASFGTYIPTRPCRSDRTDDGPDGVDGSLNSALCSNFTAADDVRVFNGAASFTTLLFFNLGDGDLTENEVAWAVNRIKNNRSTLGLPRVPIRYLVGNFANSGNARCSVYAPEDHKNVHDALFLQNLGVTEQRGSTCSSDPNASRSQATDENTWNLLFKSAHKLVATSTHDRYYGWLIGGLWSSPYSPSTSSCLYFWGGQRNCVFSQRQDFWTRF